MVDECCLIFVLSLLLIFQYVQVLVFHYYSSISKKQRMSMQSQIKSSSEAMKIEPESKARVGFCSGSQSAQISDQNVGQKFQDAKLACSIEFHKDKPQQVSMKDNRSRPDMISGISFSRFEEITEDSESQQQHQVEKYQSNQPPVVSMKKTSMNKIPTSNKVISSNKLIEEPIEVKQYDQQEHNFMREPGETEFNFSYAFLVGHELFQKFAQYSKSKEMELKIQNNQVMAVKKVSLYKTALRLCFPRSDELEHEVYQLTCPTNQTAKIKHLSGSQHKFKSFVDDFALSLWTDKYFVPSSMQENILYFVKYVNTLPNQPSVAKAKKGQIDELKQQIVTMIKNTAEKNSNSKLVFGDLKLQKKQSNQAKQYSINSTVEFIVVKDKMKQMQQKLKGLLEKQLKKQENIKANRVMQEKIKNGLNTEQQNGEAESNLKKVYVPPAVQRILLNALYRTLQLYEQVGKNLLNPKSTFEFEQKKMILKGSLSVEDIFKYLELQEFYKLFARADLSNSQQIKIVLPQSIKILSSLKHKAYPCPAYALELISIFRNTLKKQIDSFSKSPNNSVVKLQDYSNEQRTLLQFCIYCLVMCENEEIYLLIETVHLFTRDSDSTRGQLKLYHEDSVSMLKTLKKAIHFIQNEWEL